MRTWCERERKGNRKLMKRNNNIQLASTDQCTGCEACVSVCPTGSISMKEDREGFLQPHIDANTCIKCHKCEKTCPIISPIAIPAGVETQAFAAINKDEAVRMRSSSGGVFYALAKWTIDQGGVVFGARFDENWEVVHDYTETIEGIEPFMRSKYVQSRIGDTFKQAKQFLKEGRQVLFVGTPCQIGGLKSYLNKEYAKLVTIDFICHGIPSPSVWRTYTQELMTEDVLVNFNFRDKKDGWISHQCTITIDLYSKTVHTKLLENPYFRGFRKDIYLRRSCYNCDYRTYHRISDFTIADYWGVVANCQEMYDNKGTSIVFIHTSKAQNVFNDIRSNFITKKQIKENAIFGNRGMDCENPIWSPIKRRLFYAEMNVSSFHSAIKLSDGILKIEDPIMWFMKKLKRKIIKILG